MKHFGSSTVAKLMFSLVLLGHVPGCIEDEPAGPQVVSWEDFKRSAAQDVDGQVIYIVEWDLGVTEEELRERYDAYVARIERGDEHGDDGLAEAEQASIVHQTPAGADDIWPNNQQLNLTYCVSDTFGLANKGRAVSEMALATAAWEGVARVHFTYLSAHDANCNNTNPNVVFSVVPRAAAGACAFFPSASGGCGPDRTLGINFLDLDTNFGVTAPNMKTVGVFRHELGHILGLRHEHVRPVGSTCSEVDPWRELTPYDQGSVMHYPWCNGVRTSDLTISPRDALGASLLYGGRVENLAVRKLATQSSTATGGQAAHAVDGNSDGAFASNSVTHTNSQAGAWWQVDLEAVADIGEVIIYNRTDGCCTNRLSNFDIKLSNDGINWRTAVSFSGVAPARSTHSILQSSRYVRVQLRGTNFLSLAEVQVRPRNLARGKLATQSSTLSGGVASRAVDGNTSGIYANNSVTHTTSQAKAWWQVDLEAQIDIGDVVIHNRTDCCSTRLANFDVMVSKDAVTWQVVSSFTGVAPVRTPLAVHAVGRYVRVQLRGTNILSLAEVEVFGSRSLAAGRPASQSSTYRGVALASRAVDGNTDGNYANGSVSHTDLNALALAWWQVDLGSVRGIGDVVIYNRTDCCSARLANFDVQLSNDGVTWSNAVHVPLAAPARSVHSIRKQGKFVRVQLGNLNPLALAEVQVFAP
ncbi:MAG TPA: discoidin domain-containing protein [Kofleriaceae bacterium]|nr:discoidin domain-containing protein [Kofleriaceae bacterium]